MANKLTVLNPEGYPPKVTARGMAPSIEDLEGKTVALIGTGMENSDKFMVQLKASLAEHAPRVQTKLMPWPDIFNMHLIKSDDAAQRFKHVKGEADAAVLGIGCCPGCTPAVVVNQLEMEGAYGLPTVGVHTAQFERLATSRNRVGGMARARQAILPTTMMNKSAEQLRAFIESDDPVAKRPFWEQVLDSLKKPIPEGELRGVGFDRSTPRLLEGTEEELHRLFREKHYTDYLPIVLPTEERVAAMLKGTSHAPNKIVGRMQPSGAQECWEFDVEKVAVNAVMAGAAPEHFPVILALASTNDTGRDASGSSIARMVVVNGPIRNQIGMNYGIGAMGPYNHANSAIGRAYGLLSQNLQGGSVPGQTYHGSLGNNYSYNNCTYAENEENSPWEPLHVRNGFKRDESTVTTFFMWGNIWSEHVRPHWKEQLSAMLSGLDPSMGVTLVMDPIVAREFKDRGMDTPEALGRWIYENVRVPARLYWDHVPLANVARGLVAMGIEPFAGYSKLGPDELIPPFLPNQVEVVVTGGSTNGSWNVFSATAMARQAEEDNAVGLKFAKTTRSIDIWR
jgi:hypothetical protein